MIGHSDVLIGATALHYDLMVIQVLIIQWQE
jgi:hypothetical protein